MNIIFEKMYYRTQSVFIYFQKKLLKKRLGLATNIDYRIELLKTLYPIKGCVEKSDILIDVGANEGKFSQIFSDIYHPSILMCIEPNEQLNSFILMNNEKYGPIIINKAISDKETEMDFYIHPDSQMSSLFSSNKVFLMRDFAQDDAELIMRKTIPVTTLDALFLQYYKDMMGKIIFLKIDTQGNELDVIKGGRNALKVISYCLLEYMFQTPYKKQYSFEDIVAIMSENGFICRGPMHQSSRTTGEVGAVLFLFINKKLQKPIS
jgi:FkbM family methyltransferase